MAPKRFLALLRSLRRRLFAVRAVDSLADALALGGTGLIAAKMALWGGFLGKEDVLFSAAVLTPSALLLFLWLRFPTLVETASLADREGGLHNQMATALEGVHKPSPSVMEQVQVQKTLEAAAAKRRSLLVPLLPPKAFKPKLALLALAALLTWGLPEGARLPEKQPYAEGNFAAEAEAFLALADALRLDKAHIPPEILEAVKNLGERLKDTNLPLPPEEAIRKIASIERAIEAYREKKLQSGEDSLFSGKPDPETLRQWGEVAQSLAQGNSFGGNPDQFQKLFDAARNQLGDMQERLQDGTISTGERQALKQGLRQAEGALREMGNAAGTSQVGEMLKQMEQEIEGPLDPSEGALKNLQSMMASASQAAQFSRADALLAGLQGNLATARQRIASGSIASLGNGKKNEKGESPPGTPVPLTNTRHPNPLAGGEGTGQRPFTFPANLESLWRAQPLGPAAIETLPRAYRPSVARYFDLIHDFPPPHEE